MGQMKNVRLREGCVLHQMAEPAGYKYMAAAVS